MAITIKVANKSGVKKEKKKKNKKNKKK
jgi:hypothetical protein